MERSALLSHPPSSEFDPEDSVQVSSSQSCPSPVTPGNIETREEDSLAQSELERSSRPAVEGCVDTGAWETLQMLLFGNTVLPRIVGL